jgi:hypothetical protein
MSSPLTPTAEQVAEIARRQDEKEKTILAAKAKQRSHEEEEAAAVIQVRSPASYSTG